MPNPLFERLGGNQQSGTRPNIGTAFSNFMKNFRGNPEQTARALMQSGEMTQAQFEQYAQIANALTRKR